MGHRLLKAVILLHLLLFWQGAAESQTRQFSAGECAVSVNIWLLGESCIMAGLKARYGE
ncbi:hypothetical protein KKI24_28150 [bacterium]|nr:hypothetical protein [bacterium]